MEEIEDGDPWQEAEEAQFSAISEWATDVWAVREVGEWSPVLGHSGQLDLSQLEGFDALSSRSHSPEYVHPFDVEYEFDFDEDDDALGWGDVNDDWRRDITDYVAATLGKGPDDLVESTTAEPAATIAANSLQEPKKLRPFRVLVVGAGLGGLLMAQTLKKMGLAARVFSQDRDVFGAAWDDADHRLAYRITLSPATLNALRHCLPPANFRALVYHPTTHLPGSPPAVSKIPYVGRYFSAYFHGLIRPSPYTRP
ncbi:UNVERIFIED_CONTAM: hypothetical protein HDU68_008772, partial [Siphonaria sp. JEL0065]